MRVLLLGSFALLLGCGAKTGLLIPDADIDAGMDAGVDAGLDAPMCMPRVVSLRRRGAQVVFVVDRSNSMNDTLQGEERDVGDPRPSRWSIVGDTLGDTLRGADELLEVGAKFYPGVRAMGAGTPEAACSVDRGVDIPPAPGRIPSVLAVFDDTLPAGGKSNICKDS